jgi:hypothetical protein
MRCLILAACGILLACSGKKPEKSAAGDTAATDSMAAPAPRPDSGNEIHITTNAASYAPGAAVGLSIHNATAHQFAFNPCTRHFEREAHGEVTEPNRMCTMEAWLLEPNGTRDASVSLPAVIEPGTYQVRIDFAAQDSSGLQVHAISNPFTVTP